MKTMVFGTPVRGRKSPGDEGGFMLILTLLVLFTLTLLGITSIMNATIETRIAANENAANKALYAADTGLVQGLTSLNNGLVTLTATDYANPDWVYPASASADVTEDGNYYKRTTLAANNSQYRWRMRFKNETFDMNGDGDTDDVVYFNQAFGYAASLFTGSVGDEGYPVIEVLSDGFTLIKGPDCSNVDNPECRDSERRLAFEVGRNIYNVRVNGAITARSNISLTGNINIDGRNHDINGNLGGACGEDMPGAFVDDGKIIGSGGSSDLDGKDCSLPGVVCDCDGDGEDPPVLDHGVWVYPEAGCAINDGSVSLPASPWEALGIDEDQMPAAISPASVVEPLSGFVYVNGDYDMESGSGILVVHNPLFNSLAWEASTPGTPTYTADFADNGVHDDPNYDPKLDSASGLYDADYTAARAPAKFAAHGNGTYKGVVIADTVDKINGTTMFIGAVISLSSVEVSVFGNGNADILYSCEAISNYAQVGYTTKLSWRRL